MADYTTPPAPRHLGTEGRCLWRTIAREWQLEPGAEELVLLAHACNPQEMVKKAEESLENAGSLTFTDRFGQPHERPELRIIRQQRAAVAPLVKQVGQGQLAFRRLQQTEERHALLQTKRTNPGHRDRRGGGVRRVGA